jgi:hypothetical protein
MKNKDEAGDALHAGPFLTKARRSMQGLGTHGKQLVMKVLLANR